MIKCNTCKLTKEDTEYSKQASSKTGHQYACKSCSSIYATQLRKTRTITSAPLVCITCTTEKPSVEFHVNKGNASGRSMDCRVCRLKAKPSYTDDIAKQKRQAKALTFVNKCKTMYGCADCGFNTNTRALRVTKDNKETLKYTWSITKIKEEFRNGTVLCLNCQRIRGHQ